MIEPHLQVILGAFAFCSSNITPVSGISRPAGTDAGSLFWEIISDSCGGTISFQMSPFCTIKFGTGHISAMLCQFFDISFFDRKMDLFTIDYKYIFTIRTKSAVFNGGFYRKIHALVLDASSQTDDLIFKHEPGFFSFQVWCVSDLTIRILRLIGNSSRK